MVYIYIIENFTSHNFFSQNGRHIARMLTLSDFNEIWYLGVIWTGEHDGTIEMLFWATIFSFKMATISQKFQLCPISMKISFELKYFFFNENLLHSIIKCQVSDTGSWEPLVSWFMDSERNDFVVFRYFSLEKQDLLKTSWLWNFAHLVKWIWQF